MGNERMGTSHENNEAVEAACAYLRWSTGQTREKISPLYLRGAVRLAAPSIYSRGESIFFIHKWMNTPGLQVHPSNRGFRVEETAGREVIFLDGDKGSDYLLYGLNKAFEARASSIGVVTNRRFFLKKELQTFFQQVTWVLLFDDFEDQRGRFKAYCPGKIYSLPVPRHNFFRAA